jgi:undecaprenyl diphosphate synthase
VAVGDQRARDRAGADPAQHGLTLYFCVNYGGRAEIADAVVSDRAGGRRRAAQAVGPIDERTIARHLTEPSMPDVDLFVRSSGEQRTSNFLLWQSAYAEMVFLDTLWPDFDRRHLWQAVQMYAARDRRYGGAVDIPEPPPAPVL